MRFIIFLFRKFVYLIFVVIDGYIDIKVFYNIVYYSFIDYGIFLCVFLR